MQARVLQGMPRLLLTLLLAVGLSLSFLGALEIDASIFQCALLCAAGLALLFLLSLTRRSALWGSAGLLLFLLIWLTAGGGSGTLINLARGITLHFSGVSGALPLVAGEATAVVCLLFALLSHLCSRPGEGGFLALLLTLGAVLILWLADRSDLMPALIPSAIAALSLTMLERHGEASFVRILLWVSAVVLLCFAITPREGVELPALREKADTLRQAMMDRLFFTEPRDVFSLSTEGFYPQGASQLGGPAHPTNHPVMQVSTPRSVYLRGVVMNEYDGRSWRNTLGGRRYLWEAGNAASLREEIFNQRLPEGALSSALTQAQKISVRMLGDSTSTLFVPQRLQGLQAGGELVPYFTNSSELFITRNLQTGDTWSASAPLYQAGDPGISTLVEAAAESEDAAWSRMRETYTALPAHLEEPVWQLAMDITGGLASDYEKAFAIQNYLSRNYRYTLEAEYQPPQLDFVTNFLFNTREGYCTYFASAMAVLCRMAGLPARYVEGYLAEPNENGEALVTGLNAHAWTEVYFKGFGWLTFDATPRSAETGDHTGNAEEGEAQAQETATPAPPPGAEAETPQPQDQADAATAPPSEAEAPAEEDASAAPADFPWLTLLWILLALLVLGTALRWIRTAPARREKRMEQEGDKFDLWMRDIQLQLTAAGHTRRPGETLMGFTRRMDEGTGIGVPLSRLGECASLLRYGRVNALETDTALARETASALKKALSRKARLRYALMRLRPSRRFHLSGGGIPSIIGRASKVEERRRKR